MRGIAHSCRDPCRARQHERGARACLAHPQRAGGQGGGRATAAGTDAHLQRAGVASGAAAGAPGRRGDRTQKRRGERRDHCGRAARRSVARNASVELARDFCRRPSGGRRIDVFGRPAERRALRRCGWMAIFDCAARSGSQSSFFILACLSASVVRSTAVGSRTRRHPSGSRTAVTIAMECGLVAALVSVGLQGIDVLGLPLSDIREPRVWGSGVATAYGLTLCIAVAALALGLTSMSVKWPIARWYSVLALTGVGARACRERTCRHGGTRVGDKARRFPSWRELSHSGLVPCCRSQRPCMLATAGPSWCGSRRQSRCRSSCWS